MDKILVLIVGGSVGTLCRYYLAEWGMKRFGTYLPYGTLLVNLTGCLIIGILLGLFEKRFHELAEVPLQLRLLLFTGFLGALTTFSSYELEAFLLLRQGIWERALLYLASSVILGLIVILAGVKLGRQIPG